MNTQKIRIEFGGSVIRLYGKRADAINAANARTRQTEEQHRDRKFQMGYLVENVVQKKLYDDDGEIPAATAEKIYAEKVSKA